MSLDKESGKTVGDKPGPGLGQGRLARTWTIFGLQWVNFIPGKKGSWPGVSYTTLHYTTLHYTLLYTTLKYTTLNYTTLHYTTLHYTTLLKLGDHDFPNYSIFLGGGVEGQKLTST